MSGFSSLQDVEAAEVHGLPPDLPQSTYEMICRGASLNPEAPALSFFLSVNDHRTPQTWSYAALLARITQMANFFDSIGVKKDSVIAFVLPNLPETHFVIWGGQAAGIVAAFNPLLEGPALAELLNAAGASVLVTLAPFPGTDTWIKLQPHLPSIKSLRHLVLVNLADRVHGAAQCAAQVQKNEVLRLLGPQGVHGAVPMSVRIHDFNSAVQAQRADGLSIAGLHRSDSMTPRMAHTPCVEQRLRSSIVGQRTCALSSCCWGTRSWRARFDISESR